MDRYDRFFEGSPKKLPMAHSDREDVQAYLELLSIVYAESSIQPVSVHVSESDDFEDYLTHKYAEVVKSLFLEVKGEVIFPLIGLYDTGMFALNYRQFYS
jgi:hypothetical protein